MSQAKFVFFYGNIFIIEALNTTSRVLSVIGPVFQNAQRGGHGTSKNKLGSRGVNKVTTFKKLEFLHQPIICILLSWYVMDYFFFSFRLLKCQLAL